MQAVLSSARVRIFPFSDEILNLTIPLVLLLLTLGFASYLPAYSQDQRQWLAAFVAFLGLNTIHNAFTLTLFYLPEMQQWTREQSASRKRNVVFVWGAFLVFFITLFQVQFYFQDFNNYSQEMEKWYFVILKVAQTAFTTLHAYSQYFGLSILYNKTALQSANLGPAEKTRFHQVELWERRLFKPFIFVGALCVSAKWIFMSLPGEVFWIVLLFSLALGINFIAHLYPRQISSNKAIYQLRLFLVPLSLITPFGLLAVAFSHGTEYWFVYKKMVSKSKIDSGGRKKLAWITLAASVAIGLLALPRPLGGLPYFYEIFTTIPMIWAKVIVGISTAFTFFHCYMDGVLFHFSDPVTRKHISPLMQ